MEAACTNGGGLYQLRRMYIYIFMYQASSTVSSVISSSESVDLSKLELLFSTVYINIFMYQASSTVSSVISSSESVDLSKLELLFSTLLAR